jgi:hypothetical protein
MTFVLETMETGFAPLLIISILLYNRKLEHNPSPKKWIIWTILNALLIWLRIDYLIFSIFLWYDVRKLFINSPIKLAYLIASVVSISPWFVFNRLAFGEYLPSSATAFPYVLKQNFYTYYYHESLWSYLYKYIIKGNFIKYYFGFVGGWFGAVVFILMIPIYLIFNWKKDKSFFLLSIAALTYGTVHILRFFPRTYYSVPFHFIVIGLFIGVLLKVKKLPLYSIIAVYIFLILFGWHQFFENRIPHLRGRNFHYTTLKALDLMSETEKVGAFNCGILNFYSEREIYNLDGCVNPVVAKYIFEHDLFSYIDSIGIRFIYDDPFYVIKAFAPVGGEDFGKYIIPVKEIRDGAKRKIIFINATEEEYQHVQSNQNN